MTTYKYRLLVLKYDLQVGVVALVIGFSIFVWYALQPEIQRLSDAWDAIADGKYGEIITRGTQERFQFYEYRKTNLK